MVYLLKMVIFHGYVSHNQMVTMKNHGFRESNGAPFRGLLLWVMLKGSRGKPWRKTPRRMITLSRLWGSIVTCHGKIWRRKSMGNLQKSMDWEWWIQGIILVDGLMMNSWIITTTMGWDRNRRGSTAKSCELIIWVTYEIYQGPLTISNVHCHTRG